MSDPRITPHYRREQIEERLRTTEERFRQAQAAGGIGWFEWDLATGEWEWTPHIATLFGFAAAGAPSSFASAERTIFPDDVPKLHAAVESASQSGAYYTEFRVKHPDGSVHWIAGKGEASSDDSGRTRWIAGVYYDISERKTLEARLLGLNETLETRVAQLREAEAALQRANETLEQRVHEETKKRQETEDALRQAQKMESIGQLTGGIAHDFNNLLTVILGNMETLQRRLPPTHEGQRMAAAARDSASRGAQLTHRLLAFARRSPLAPEVLSPNKLVTGMSELLRRALGETVRVRAVLADELWSTFADANQLENALINLAVNARDAMPGGGKLAIETANCEFDDTDISRRGDLPPGQYVGIFVTDTGTGMAAEIIDKVFEPFFTTKEIGHGTGLGLSQVYGFIKQSGGHVHIDSAIGKGTTVKLYLPRYQDTIAAAGPEPENADSPRAKPGETVLVVEDDPDVRDYTVTAVSELGYGVTTAGNGATALQKLENNPELKLLFTDVGLPGGMDGKQLADEALRRRPDLRVLFTTGYARDAIVHQGRLDPGIEVVLKPFGISELAVKLRRVFDA
jgi:PAS domain S-box-containing protein